MITKEKAIEEARSEMVKELLRRAKAGEKLPVGVSGTIRGISKYIDAIPDRIVGDWYTTIWG